jgi:riboflavin synthase
MLLHNEESEGFTEMPPQDTDRQIELEVLARQLILETNADELNDQLSRYRVLRESEVELRERVHFLERLIAEKGYLQTPVSLGLQLEKEQDELTMLREELGTLIAKLETILDIPVDERTNLDADRLAQLITEVKAKREQESIYRRNIRHLEEMQARLVDAVRIDLFNELHLTRTKLDELHSELGRLERQLWDGWHMDSDTIAAVVRMNSRQIAKFSYDVALRKYGRDLRSRGHWMDSHHISDDSSQSHHRHHHDFGSHDYFDPDAYSDAI